MNAMQYEDEKDYLIRMIKQVAKILFSLMLGKEYVQVAMEDENKFEVSGRKLDEYKAMVDRGEVNEAENFLLENIDYNSKDEVAAAVLFYQYVGEKGEAFLKQYNYTAEEALEGLKQLAERAGYGGVCDIL